MPDQHVEEGFAIFNIDGRTCPWCRTKDKLLFTFEERVVSLGLPNFPVVELSVLCSNCTATWLTWFKHTGEVYYNEG